MNRSRFLAILQVLLVSLIWASSFVVIKLGLAYLNPLTLAGLRYFVAFLLLMPWLMMQIRRNGNSAQGHWRRLFWMGLCAYPIGNGMLYWGLQFIPATTGSFLFSLTPLPVLFLGIFLLKEVPTGWQIVGLMVTVAGSALFFSAGFRPGEPWGVGAVAFGLFAFAIFTILGRGMVRGGRVDTLSVTAIPLGFGGGILMIIALFLEGLPEFSWKGWGIVLWLAAVNTSFAYLLYNRALRVLTALELNVLLNLMPLETALLAVLTLNEQMTIVKVVGMVMVVLGVIIVQWKTGEQEESQQINTEAKLIRK